MPLKTAGIHHITAFVGDAQQNVDFYAGILGLRLVKKTVHHIAWRTKDDEEQLQWRQHVQSDGYQPTPVQDRQYFNAVYFREEGGILFEIATDPPGFALDEEANALGEKLMLPEWFESHRSQIESNLAPIQVRKPEVDRL